MDKDRQGLDPTLADLLDEEVAHTPDSEDFVYCATCSSVITRSIHAIKINGVHAHRCTNPHGFEFHLGCYSQALGCDISGDRTHADSWFAGYQWRFASCAECKQHLGWYFDRADEHFYGLIFDRIQTS